MRKRQEALKDQILINNQEYVSGSIEHNNEKVDIDIRLKGDLTDHISDKDKLSFRVVVKDGKTVIGMDKFSLQHPKTRNWLGEWLFHKVIKDQGIISLKYDFVRVILNGKDLGIYAIEEHFTSLMLENNKRRPGPIMKFSERLFWDQRSKYNVVSHPTTSGHGGFYSSKIQSFNKKKINSDSVLSLQFQKASSLLSDFRQGKKDTKQTFDIERLSSYFALNDLFQAHHGARWNNVRLYFNPINNVFEPISFDAQIRAMKPFLACNPVPDLITSYAPYFEDEDFYKLYLSKLVKYGNASFFQSILDKYKEDIDEITKLLRSEWPEYEPNYYKLIYENINFIRSILKPGKFINSRLSIVKSELNLSVGNLQILPITNLHLKFPNDFKITAKSNFILKGKNKMKYCKYKKVDMERSDYLYKGKYEEIKLGFQIIGIDSIIYEDLTSINFGEENTFSDLVNKNLHFNNLDFISEIPETNEITFKNGSHTIKTDIYIPENKVVFIPKGTKLDFINNCYIYSRSPIQINGDEDSPIFLFSSDSSGAEFY